MRQPNRPDSGYSITEWAAAFRAKNPWLVRLSQLAGHNPKVRLEIEAACTYYEAALDFKAKLAVSESAYDKSADPPQRNLIIPARY